MAPSLSGQRVMKARRHHNNDGRRQVRLGKTVVQVRAMAKRLGLVYAPRIEARQGQDPQGLGSREPDKAPNPGIPSGGI